jgi:hypothetical protein
MIRQSLIAALTGATMLGGAWAAAASVARPADLAKSSPGGAGSSSSAALVPRATGVPLSPAALAAGAGRCAGWASRAGFASNGYLAGSLTSAVAIALAESGCDPSACYDDTTRAPCASRIPPGDSVDRGAWQINNGNSITAGCAYGGPCAARYAYRQLSRDGGDFAPWTTYLAGTYARYLPAAQAAVNAVAAGTVTSGLAGSCLGYPADTVRAAVIAENCGTGAASQQWTIHGRTLRTSGGLCLTASSRSLAGPVVLSGCDGSSLQNWLAHADAALYNRPARRCLTDPGAAGLPGTVIGDSACNGMQDQAWFRP